MAMIAGLPYENLDPPVIAAHLDAERRERQRRRRRGQRDYVQVRLKLLGDVKLTDLNTAMIRAWHRTVTEQCGAYTANRAKSHLKSILALAEEDVGIRAPSMPTGLPRVRHRAKKAILTSGHIATLIAAAKDDPEQGIYYAFAFLAGTRPSEQLGLLWSEVDFEHNASAFAVFRNATER